MTSRDLSRTDKPLAPIGNILNSDHVPVYRRPRQSSLRKKSMNSNAKLHLYDFDVGGENGKVKKFKKSQKVRKRARICVRHNKENAPIKSNKTGLFDPFRIEPPNHKVAGENKFLLANKINGVNKHKPPPFTEIQVQADVHKFSPVDDDILSVTSERCCLNESTDDEGDFRGFAEEDCRDLPNAAIETYGLKTPKDKANRIQYHKLSNTPNPYMTPDPYRTPYKLASRASFIPVIELSESLRGNQLQPNRSSQNINPNETFNNLSYAADRFYSTPVKDNSFNSTSLSDLSSNDFNVTNCFGFEEPDNLNEEFLVSPIKLNGRQLHVRAPTAIQGPARAQLPSVKDVINRLKEEMEDADVKPVHLFAPDIDCSTLKAVQITPYLNSSSLDYVSQELSSEVERAEPKVAGVTFAEGDQLKVSKSKPVRRSYERPVYMRQRKNSHKEDSDVEEHRVHEDGMTEKVKTKKKQNIKKKVGPTKKEVDELEKWAQAFNSQCAQVEAFDLCIE